MIILLWDTKEYVWDAASRVMQAKEGGIWTTYGYDFIDQLTSEVKSALNYTASYTYDANSNRLTRTVNQSTETYAYDDADKLLSITGGPNPRTYTYDQSGRTKTIVDTSGTTYPCRLLGNLIGKGAVIWHGNVLKEGLEARS